MNFAYTMGAIRARKKLGYDMAEEELEDMLGEAITDEVKGVEEYEDLATTARDAGHSSMAKNLESHAADESRHAKENVESLKAAD